MKNFIRGIRYEHTDISDDPVFDFKMKVSSQGQVK